VENYGRRLIVDRPFHSVLTAAIDALHAEGFEIIGRVNVRDLLERTMHHDCRRYVLLHAATPQTVLDALQVDLGSPTISPFAVAVFELADGETAVVTTEPWAPLLADASWQAHAPELSDLAHRECDRVARVVGRLQHALAERAPIRDEAEAVAAHR
jgi:uncharacterized protein (DUF302 family)